MVPLMRSTGISLRVLLTVMVWLACAGVARGGCAITASFGSRVPNSNMPMIPMGEGSSCAGPSSVKKSKRFEIKKSGMSWLSGLGIGEIRRAALFSERRAPTRSRRHFFAEAMRLMRGIAGKKCCRDSVLSSSEQKKQKNHFVLWEQIGLSCGSRLVGATLAVNSYNKRRLQQNARVFDWELSQEDLDKISQIPQRKMMPTELISANGPYIFVFFFFLLA
ncbi:hypothetical protein M0R45_031611 [Rubus argutus]|uniref:Uncharacterized protein n=1 Tax=Rubus argutus TaxID=59490 RepID=A0AAW1WGY3_RUBAR